MNKFLDFFGLQKKADNKISGLPAQIFFQFHGGAPVIFYSQNTDTYLRKGYEGNHVVFTIADWVGKKIAQVPPILYTTKDKGAAKEYKQLRKEGSFENYLTAQRIKARAFDEVENHPIVDLLRKPNPTMFWDEFIYGSYIFKTFVGNSKIYKIATDNGVNAGKPQQIWLLPSNYFRPIGGVGFEPVIGYEDTRSPSIVLPTKDVIVIRRFSANYQVPGAHLEGMSILQSATKLLTRSNESMSASTESLQNRGARDLVFPNLTAEQLAMMSSSLPGDVTIDSINAELRKRLREAGNDGVVMNSVPLGKITLGFSPRDMEVAEGEIKDGQSFAALFHVDSRVVLNDHQSSTKDNMQGARLNSITDAVFPECEANRNAFQENIVDAFGDYYLDFDYTIFPEIQKELRDTAEKMAATGVFTVNEIRNTWKYDDYSGLNGDKILVGTNKQILDDMDSALPAQDNLGDYNLNENENN